MIQINDNNKNFHELKVISDEIEKKRQEMHKSIDEKGPNHPDTIKISQELDILLNKYMRMSSKK